MDGDLNMNGKSIKGLSNTPIIRNDEAVRWARAVALVTDATTNSSVSRQLVYGHFVYDTSSTDISSTDISSTITFLAEIEAGVMKRILYH